MKKGINLKILSLLLIGSCLLIVSSCKKEDDPAPIEQPDVIIYDTIVAPPNMVYDASGNLYSTVVIGDQRWMRENLRTSHFNNGDPIPYVPAVTEWSAMSSAAWSYYDNDAAYGEIYGKLYNWYTVSDPRNVCPAGWHVPTDEEWMELEVTLGVPEAELTMTTPRGVAENAGGKMKSTLLWDSPNTGADNSAGFLGYPAGTRGVSGDFVNLGTRAKWWTASPAPILQDQAIDHQLWWNSAGIYRLTNIRRAGSSIRCVQD